MTHDFNESNDFVDSMKFGEFFRKKRRILGLNQIDFAEIFGINQETVSKWESGKSSPPIEKARQIVNILGGDIKIINLVDEACEYEDGRGEARINGLINDYMQYGITQAVI